MMSSVLEWGERREKKEEGRGRMEGRETIEERRYGRKREKRLRGKVQNIKCEVQVSTSET